MLGPKLYIEIEGFGVTLRPIRKEDITAEMVDQMSSLSVIQYLAMAPHGATLEDELDWYEKIRNDDHSYQWGILPDGFDKIVGCTSIHFGNSPAITCSSGILMWNRKAWGRGVAYRAHLIRTWFAARRLNRHTIQSGAWEHNAGSRGALTKVGYIETGLDLRNRYINGWADTIKFSWINPEKVHLLYPNYPKDLPPKYRKEILKGLKVATKALELADAHIKLI